MLGSENSPKYLIVTNASGATEFRDFDRLRNFDTQVFESPQYLDRYLLTPKARPGGTRIRAPL